MDMNYKENNPKDISKMPILHCEGFHKNNGRTETAVYRKKVIYTVHNCHQLILTMAI